MHPRARESEKSFFKNFYWVRRVRVVEGLIFN